MKLIFDSLLQKFAPDERSDCAPFTDLPPNPERFDGMRKLAGELSAGHPFLRVDLYQMNGKIYFTELTFSPCGGFMPWKDHRSDQEIGSMLPRPKRKCAADVSD